MTVNVTVTDADVGIDVSVSTGVPDNATFDAVTSDKVTIRQTVPTGDIIDIPSDYGMSVAGPYDVNGDINLDGTLTVAPGPITGTGSISGSGRIYIP